ncbi:MAG: TIGR02678 family protein [Clostridia bacterium]
MTTFEKLLENYWFVRDIDVDTYNSIKRELNNETQEFIKNKLGYKLIVNPYVIKMEKIPGKPQTFMGIESFNSKLDYVFLCLILIYLEERTKGEQFILSGLIDYIQNLITEVDLQDIKIDFTIYSHRKAMVNVLKFIKNMGFIIMYDGDENKFAEDIETDVLYEVTGVSKYFMRKFSSNITDCNLYTDIYEKEQLGLEQDKGKERRQRVYRRLFTENVIYKENEDDQDYNYIRNYRNIINQDVDKMLESTLEVHRNGAYILLTENKNFKNTFPSNRAISDVVSFINTIIVEKLKEGKFRKNINDTINISEIEFVKLVREVKEKYSKGFSKEFRELQEDKLAEQTADYMKQYDMIRYNDEAKEYIIMPICFKIIGKYPKDFQI